MKFCKNLQRLVDIADPEWAPYWINYKMLKKLIKELPSLVHAGECTRMGSHSQATAGEGSFSDPRQRWGDSTRQAKAKVNRNMNGEVASTTAALATAEEQYKSTNIEENNGNGSHRSDVESIGKSPGEIAFFKLLHAECKKAAHFFEKAQEEYIIRVARVVQGMELMKQPNAIMVGEKWSFLAKSIYKLYKDLLLLETFAIMSFCAFSKILKKHDKVSGYNTRNSFMENIVNKASFSNYPKVLEMISKCEQLYEDVSDRLIQDGKNGLYEDERLFINMIHRLNEQVIDSVEGDAAVPERKEARRPSPSTVTTRAPLIQTTTWATTSLRRLVEENDATKIAAQVSEGHTGVDSDEDAHADVVACHPAESPCQSVNDNKTAEHQAFSGSDKGFGSRKPKRCNISAGPLLKRHKNVL